MFNAYLVHLLALKEVETDRQTDWRTDGRTDNCLSWAAFAAENAPQKYSRARGNAQIRILSKLSKILKKEKRFRIYCCNYRGQGWINCGSVDLAMDNFHL